ncbi:LMBR1 domain-containing protein 2 homolog isoform X2 [Neocloeon triangulifer]|uniref:LMBR1 domain-containing protein 2 homolog isoform X2 n=1 Tax=Neocloeon triangulifer TaxID=2078957 RepID=UPI00286FA11F|nr:LMBR1 domain-containing protein 2 homolog isoform X2 [Neocloeon triangulifer]
MSLGPLIGEVVITFVLAACLLYRYGNWFKHHIIVTVSVLVAWYFSFLIIFVLPLDVSSTVYRQCMQTLNASTEPPETKNGSSSDSPSCHVPWSYVPDEVFPDLWRVVYWTSQFLTWLILPLMQSYTKAGDFTVKGKLRSALIDNAIYYSTYLFICCVLFVYLVLKPGLDVDGSKLKVIASSASNTWGLFLLVLLLGHALVEVPRSLWRASSYGHSLSKAYFRTAKLSSERSESEEAVDDVLEHLQAVTLSVGPGHYLHRHLETIMQKIPAEIRDRMGRRPPADGSVPDEPTEKSLVRLHKQVKKALQMQHRTEAQWVILLDKVIALEDASRFFSNHARPNSWWPPSQRNQKINHIYKAKLNFVCIDWYWRGKEYFLKAAAVCAGTLSAAIIWSEVTFFVKDPVLSIFARIVNLAKSNYDYFTIELISTLVIAYLCYCAYSTVFKVRVLNFYYLAGHHGTDEYSLIFSGMMLCRLTPPMCLNFLGLIHMDSHVIKTRILETHYTQVMGHMDVIGIVSDGFNIYFPTVLLLLCAATYFSLGSRLLSALGFHQFIGGEDEMTADLIDEGRDLVKREKRRRQRTEETSARRRDFHERFGTSLGIRRMRNDDRVRRSEELESQESARAVLLRDVEPLDYSSAELHPEDETLRLPERTRFNQLPRGLFDDV